MDEGLQGNAWGSINVDDEGMATQHTQLIGDGVLTGFLVDRMGPFAPATPAPVPGAGNPTSSPRLPACANTYIEPGNYSLDDMLATVEHGIYAKRMGVALCSQVPASSTSACRRPTSSRGQDHPAPRVGHPDRHRPAGIEGDLHGGARSALSAGMCGSVSGSIPASVGQPPLKVDSILVGGNA